MELIRGLEVSDELLGTFTPIIVYWIFSGMYLLLEPLEGYRLHTKKDEDEKRGMWSKECCFSRLFRLSPPQSSLLKVTGGGGESMQAQEVSPLVLARQFLVAMMGLDTWQYFMHQYVHLNKFLYWHIHSQHHWLVVPYTFGALYNHLFLTQ